MHAFDLSHPNLSAFLFKFDLINKFIDKETLKIKPLEIVKLFLFFFIIKLPIFIIIKLPMMLINKLTNNGKNKKGNKPLFKQIVDTISFFEIPHEYQFLVMEHYLKNCNKQDVGDKKIKIGDNCYEKIIICPLVIDFGYKNIPEQLHYKITPKSPIASQTGDMFYAIRTYYRFKMILNEAKNRFDLSSEDEKWYENRGLKYFEIYPFMGLDTRNYESIQDLKQLLNKYFRAFKKEDTPDFRKDCLFKKMGMLDSNMYRDKQILTQEDEVKLSTANIAFDYQYAFAGIKVYPQLGFDPYPDHLRYSKDIDEILDNYIDNDLDIDKDILDVLNNDFYKVKFLYKYCVAKRIPITTHCSDGGYKTSANNDKLTSPLTKWTKVLDDYPELTLNFAHFGSQEKGKMKWRNAIIKLTEKYDNVYTDISCNDMKKAYYDKLKGDLKNNIHLQDKVLFGSDFSINMLVTDTDSYNENLEAFANAELPYKDNLCELNPFRFLFGK